VAPVFEHATELPHPAQAVFDYHANPGAFRRLVPAWEHVRFRTDPAPLVAGHTETVQVKVGPLWLRWVARIDEVTPGRGFRDVQLQGPFRRWEHEHRFEPLPDGRCRLVDRVTFEPPFGPPGRWFGEGHVRARLARMFQFRHAVTACDLAALSARRSAEPMKIAITGASGLLGSHLEPFLTAGGHAVTRLVRRDPIRPDEARWDPTGQAAPDPRLEGHHAVIHLAGEGIADKRWSPTQKQRIHDSRVLGTQHLVQTLAKLERPPRVLLCASAIGWYGDRGDERLTEASTPGDDFLAGVCRGWEDVAQRYTEEGARVVNLRFGAMLSPRGGALAKMLPAFRLGVAGRIGSGDQWMSWVGLDDAAHAVHHALHTESLQGPVNVVAPTPVTNRVFTKTLGRILRRPTVAPMPAAAARLVFGEVADALLLASQRVHPTALLESGFTFGHPDLEGCLRHLLGRPLPARAGA
jgi:uncharacterized protein (TIGR01777 family)